MNGIVHQCSHPNDANAHFRLSEEKMFEAIFQYISNIFSIIKPLNVFFMAIDGWSVVIAKLLLGVAPRAKINQQRSRRFRTAQEASKLVKEALKRGEVLPKEEAFDTNCITPGTEFMAQLSAHLIYFVNLQISKDENWRKCKVILSGPEVPGEGEHKIMEYIRSVRSETTGYNHNTRHCLYGLDADLIMLGLATHEPHFCLLREEVVSKSRKPTRGSNNSTKSSQKSDFSPSTPHAQPQKFFLLHLSLMREYMDLDFGVVSGTLPFKYNLESIIDDFILMAVFMGNDFLPHLPDFHIDQGGLSRIFALYKNNLPTFGGYINEGGRISMDRLELFLSALVTSDRDAMHLKETAAAGRDGSDDSVITKKQHEILNQIIRLHLSPPKLHDIFLDRSGSQDERFVLEIATNLNMAATKLSDGRLIVSRILPLADNDDERAEEENELDASNVDGPNDDDFQLARLFYPNQFTVQRAIAHYANSRMTDSLSRLNVADAEWLERKIDFYQEKLEIDWNDKASVRKVCASWLQGLQFVMLYYYCGVPSWSWFYPFYYAPSISDLIPNSKLILASLPELELGAPFHPFEQLMGVLPARSAKLLPECFRSLMSDFHSPIIDFYPENFAFDMNGKKNDWEAVVKVPFVDEKRLLDAMRPKLALLNQQEAKRNELGHLLTFTFSPNNPLECYKSPLSTPLYPDIVPCYSRSSIICIEKFDSKNAPVGLLSGARLRFESMAGFPTLHSLTVNGCLKRHGIKIQFMASTDETVVLTVANRFDGWEQEDVVKALLGSSVNASWPNLVEGLVETISTLQCSYKCVETLVDRPLPLHSSSDWTRTPMDAASREAWRYRASKVANDLSSHSGVVIGETQMMATVRLFTEMRRNNDGSTSKAFGASWDYPIQLLVDPKTTTVDHRFVEQDSRSLEAEYPIGARCLFLEAQQYGARATVSSILPNQTLEISVEHQTKAHDFSSNIKQRERYLAAKVIAKSCGLSPFALSQLTSSILVARNNGTSANLGLGLKFERRGLKVPGMTRKSSFGVWEFSLAARDLVLNYRNSFPALFDSLMENKLTNGRVAEDALDFDLDLILDWQQDEKISDFILVPVENVELSPDFIREMEIILVEQAEPFSAPPVLAEALLSGVQPDSIILQSHFKQRLAGAHHRFDLGHRVAVLECPNDFDRIIFGATGYVVRVEAVSGEAAPCTFIVTLILCQEFPCAQMLENICSTRRGLIVESQNLLNLSLLQYPEKLLKSVPHRSNAPAVASTASSSEPARSIKKWENPSKNGAALNSWTRVPNSLRPPLQKPAVKFETAAASIQLVPSASSYSASNSQNQRATTITTEMAESAGRENIVTSESTRHTSKLSSQQDAESLIKSMLHIQPPLSITLRAVTKPHTKTSVNMEAGAKLKRFLNIIGDGGTTEAPLPPPLLCLKSSGGTNDRSRARHAAFPSPPIPQPPIWTRGRLNTSVSSTMVPQTKSSTPNILDINVDGNQQRSRASKQLLAQLK